MKAINIEIVQTKQAIEASRDVFMQSSYEIIRCLSTKISNPEFCDIRDKFVSVRDYAGEIIMEKSKPFITLYAGRIIAKDITLFSENFDQTIEINAQQLAAKSNKTTAEATEYISKIIGQVKHALPQYTVDETNFLWMHLEKLVRSSANCLVANRKLKMLEDQKLEMSMRSMNISK